MTTVQMTIVIPDKPFFDFLARVTARMYFFGALTRKDVTRVVEFIVDHYPWYIV